jgi:DNA-binding SARP family transcriptional activator
MWVSDDEICVRSIEFRILGPLEVWHEGVEVSLGGRKPRALLAGLLLRANEVVPADRLIDELWGEDSPQDAAAALRVNVSRLRKALPQDVVTTRPPGYVVRVEPDALDLHRFERLADEGRSLLARGRAADASDRLRHALSLWTGPALADFAYESFAQAAIARLEEIRLAAIELRIDADLALGRHEELVGELEALVAEHPLRERLRRCLMTALYRSGRQAEALDVYRNARRVLVDGLGIEPSASLHELERAILRQDPSLDLEAPTPTRVPKVAERSIFVSTADKTRVDGLLAVAEPLVQHPPRVVILATLVPGVAELRSGSARRRIWLGSRRSSTSSSCSPTLPTNSSSAEFRTRSSFPSSGRQRVPITSKRAEDSSKSSTLDGPRSTRATSVACADDPAFVAPSGADAESLLRI